MRFSASRVLLVLLVLPTISYAGLTCLSCRGSIVTKYCETIDRCGDSEACFTDTYATALGDIRFDLGCRESQQCIRGPPSDRFGSSSDRLLNSTCCQGILCNVGDGTIQGYTSPRGPVCFHCSTQDHYDSCNIIKVCGINEKCIIHTKIGHNGLLETGCERDTICHAGAIVGKRDNIRFGRDASCAECCDADLCNDKCLKPGVNVSPCATHPCINGQCHEIGTAYVCQCRPGYGGNQCEHHILADLCLSNPCVFGKCTNYGSYYGCTCDSGYTGVNCDVSHHDACRNTPCVHGTCLPQGLTYTCKCDNGYIGADCDQAQHDACRNTPCVHGTCSPQGLMYACQCDKGYIGANCDQAVAVDHCLSSPCRHGTCTNFAYGFSCTCYTGYSGMTCDLLAIQDPCLPNPCVHGACARKGSSTTDFHCLCTGEHYGQLCDQGCSGVDPSCHPGAVCVVLDQNNCQFCRPDCL